MFIFYIDSYWIFNLFNLVYVYQITKRSSSSMEDLFSIISIYINMDNMENSSLEKVIYQLGFTIKRTCVKRVPFVFSDGHILVNRYTKPIEKTKKHGFMDKWSIFLFHKLLYPKKYNAKSIEDEFIDVSIKKSDDFFSATIWTQLESSIGSGSVRPFSSSPSHVTPCIVDVKRPENVTLYKIILNKKQFYDKYQSLFREIQLKELGV